MVGRGATMRDAARAENAQGTPTQSHTSPSILVYRENDYSGWRLGVTIFPGVFGVYEDAPGTRREWTRTARARRFIISGVFGVYENAPEGGGS